MTQKTEPIKRICPTCHCLTAGNWCEFCGAIQPTEKDLKRGEELLQLGDSSYIAQTIAWERHVAEQIVKLNAKPLN